MALIQLYNLEGQPMEMWDTANGPIPGGRWDSPQGGKQWQQSNGNLNTLNPPSVPFGQFGYAGNQPSGALSVSPGTVPSNTGPFASPNGPTTPAVAGAGNNPFGITGIGSTGDGVVNSGGGLPALPVTSTPSTGTGGGTTTGGGVTSGGTIPGTNISLRNLMGEGSQTLQAQAALAPLMAQLYQTYAPIYAQTDLNNLSSTLFGNFDAAKFYAAHPGAQQEFENAQKAGQLQGWTPAQFAQAYTNASGPYDDSLKQYYTGGTAGINNWLTQNANTQTALGNTAIRNANLGDVNTLAGQYKTALFGQNPFLYGTAANNYTDGALGQVAQNASSIFGQPNTYQTALGNAFNGGAYKPTAISPTDISAQNVNAGQLAAPQSVSATNNPLLGYAQQAAQSQMGGSGLQNDLVSQARQQLALGGSLSDEDQRNAQQAAREAWAARGLVNSPGAVGAEILNRDALSRQRLQERQNFASGVLGQEQQGQNLSNSFLGNIVGQGFNQGAQNLQAQLANQSAGLQAGTTNLQAGLQAALANQSAGLNASSQNAANSLAAQQYNSGADTNAYNNWLSQGGNLASMEYGRGQQLFSNLLANANLQSANQFNPFSTVLGSGTSNQGLNSGLFSQGAGVNSGGTSNQGVTNMFNPYNGYSSDLFNTNTNAQASVYNSQLNNAASKSASNNSLLGAGLGAIGNLFGGAMGASIFCWVAREAYGVENPKWLQFREWMLHKAPDDFRDWYLTNGERIADAIKDNFTVKAEIRGMMDNILEMEAA